MILTKQYKILGEDDLKGDHWIFMTDSRERCLKSYLAIKKYYRNVRITCGNKEYQDDNLSDLP
jgi:hypothetical protein